jgi:hypothetical protein
MRIGLGVKLYGAFIALALVGVLVSGGMADQAVRREARAR